VSSYHDYTLLHIANDNAQLKLNCC